MPSENLQIETLKYILENSHQPEQLDQHPWARSLLARESAAKTASPGEQLLAAIGELFARMMPSTPPRQGKRLDTRWGEFGLLAAQYFAPLAFGTPVPPSLRDAWGRIDSSILLFVYGKPQEIPSKAERDAYKLVGDELEVAPYSTLSDWHRKGLQRLLEMILAREAYLSKSLSKPAVISQNGQELLLSAGASRPQADRKGMPRRSSSRGRRLIFSALGLLLLGLLLAAGLKAWRVYKLVLLVRQDVEQLQSVMNTQAGRLEQLKSAGPALSTLRQDFATLKAETQPFFWLGPSLGWLPQYGGELAEIQDLATFGDSLLASADISVQTVAPFLENDNLSQPTLSSLAEFLSQSQPQFLEAQKNLEQAAAARDRLDLERLSPLVRGLIVDEIDPLMALMQDGLTIAVEAPRALGATSEGPKTYLLLALNEDELRPNGGFITAAGTLLIQDSHLISFSFRNSSLLDDWTKPYPAAPWQLTKYMNSPVLVLRDASWFADYSTSAWYAENFYAYVSDHSVDGVIAFDQQLLVSLLRATGPIQLENMDTPIDADNVISYMRSAKTPTLEERSVTWDDKAFINRIGMALSEKLLAGDVDLASLSNTLLRALDEHNILIQVDNPALADFFARHHWDGTVRAGNGDFLLVADSNIGFNKTSAVVETTIAYDVDLTDPLSPTASLTVLHKNNAAAMVTCSQWDKVRVEGEEGYPITDCYWNYMRVYRPAGTTLLDASPQFIPANWMMNYQSVPAQVDILNEDIQSIQAFGTLKVVPGGQSVTTDFRFSLPPSIFETLPNDGVAYHLKVQKQPGTLAVPLLIRVHLAPEVTITQTAPGAAIENNTVLYQTDLRLDREFEIIYMLP